MSRPAIWANTNNWFVDRVAAASRSIHLRCVEKSYRGAANIILPYTVEIRASVSPMILGTPSFVIYPLKHSY